MSKLKSACIFSTLAAIFLLTSPQSDAASVTVRAKFSFDALADCQQPSVKDFPVHAEGTGTLSTDRTATLDMQSNVEGHMQYTAKLGAKPTEAVGGSASLRVAGRHTLKAVREYPNNYIIVYMTVIGNACSLKIENKLKPGQRQYAFQGNIGTALCSRPRIVRSECTPY
ncbi:hypothetical protein L6654_12050 [Bradyrhizobium sp. WYCCWR 13023]|uniref:Uncharacterized protein n=1 Tax=Bradyrhizobium zhengyangense TaxID=2911009 RepID=A0A9X1U719_9BRAD|nr:hypothetical protein [Bradyrhizobium zhengyangense]MCG2627360.1 hypothetical protein [Bradyrhizobium zhengyangense]MCG2645093.1 hypothetical protein [Bradyrhizobium zhengyangense]MCG2668105.1 hypothetical protein [Bradyrhizobium zhengyangense]